MTKASININLTRTFHSHWWLEFYIDTNDETWKHIQNNPCQKDSKTQVKHEDAQLY